MTNQPANLDLDEIAARAAAATPGPWGVYEYGGETKLDIAADLQETGCGYRARREIASLEDEPLDNDPAHREWTAEEDWAQVQADAAFIAHAREDVDALVDEIRRLRDQMAAVTELLDQQELAARAFDVPLPEWITAVRHAIEHKPVAEESHVVADDSDDFPGGSRQCGHDDYHDAHEWADKPGVWCPGHSTPAVPAPAGE